MGNKVKYNLKNVHAAKLTETVSSSGETTFSYESPKAIPGAVSISLDAEGESTPFYADGIVYFRSVTNNGYSGDLEIALIPEWSGQRSYRRSWMEKVCLWKVQISGKA